VTLEMGKWARSIKEIENKTTKNILKSVFEQILLTVEINEIFRLIKYTEEINNKD
jgi:hypothetical protein